MHQRVLIRLVGLLAGVILTTLLVGCGGGGSSSPTGKAEFVVNWPPPSRLIPAATKSIGVEIKNGTQQLARKIIVQPQLGTTSTIAFNSLPVGDFIATATAYPNIDGTGTPLAQASTPLQIQQQKTTQFTIIMQSTITHLDLSPLSPSVAGGQTVQLTATPKDASDRVVMVAPGKIQWSSSNPTVASVVSDRGTVTGLTVGTAQITVTEAESGKTATTTVTVTSNAGNPGGLAASGWPKSQADARNTGRALGGGAIGTEKWRNGPYPSGVTDLVLGPGGSIYGTSYSGGVYKFDGATGAVIWQKIGTSGTTSSYPAVAADGTVYVMQSFGFQGVQKTDCYAFNGSSGGIKWKTTIDGYTDKPAVALATDGTVYMANSTGTYALDPTTGAIKWHYNHYDPVASARPAIAQDGTVIVNGEGMYALDPATGAEKWITPGYEFGAPAIGDDGTVYVHSNKGGPIFAFDGATGAQKWQVDFRDTAGPMSFQGGIALGHDGTLYILGQLYVHALDPITGAEKWAYRTSYQPHTPYDEILTTPAVGSDGTVYVAADKLYALDPATGAEKWEFRSPADPGGVGVPAIGPDGTIYTTISVQVPNSTSTVPYLAALR